MNFIKAAHHHANSIIKLYAELNSEDPIINIEDATTFIKKIENSKNLYLFLLNIDGHIVATTYLNVIPNLTRGQRPYAIIENVVVLKEERNKGYGKIIVRKTLEFALSKNCYKVLLQTGSKKEETHKFYEACGFIKGERTAFIAFPQS